MIRRLLLLLATLLALAVAVTACGGDDDDDAADEPAPAAEDTTTHEEDAGGAAHLALAADPSGAPAFDQTELTAAAGEVTIEFTNDSGVAHNVEIEGDGVSETISEGSTELVAMLEAGEYAFFCNIPGHREGGMEGTLTVD